MACTRSSAIAVGSASSGWLNPAYLWWLLPVVGALILSIPLSVLTSGTNLGRRLRRRKYFLIPEESHPPPVIRATRRYWHHAPHPADVAAAVVDPMVNALICAQVVGRNGTGRVRELLNTVVADRALHHGLDQLSAAEKNQLIADPDALSALHWAVWTSPATRHSSWRALIEQPPARPRVVVAVAPVSRERCASQPRRSRHRTWRALNARVGPISPVAHRCPTNR